LRGTSCHGRAPSLRVAMQRKHVKGVFMASFAGLTGRFHSQPRDQFHTQGRQSN
jgi:hypothetical protein